MIERNAQPLSEHLSALRERSGMSMEDVASAAGYAGRSSVQRYFTDPDIETLQPAVASKLAKALYGKGDPPIGVEDLARLVTTNWDSALQSISSIAHLLKIHGAIEPLKVSSVQPAKSGMLPIMGSAHASNWMESTPSLDEPEGWIAIPFATYDADSGQYALRIVGPSINRTASDGHFAICQKYGQGSHSHPNGKFVHVERVRGDFVEWTIKRVRWDDAGMTLWPDSDHPEHVAAIKMGEPGARVTILGIVTGWYKPA